VIRNLNFVISKTSLFEFLSRLTCKVLWRRRIRHKYRISKEDIKEWLTRSTAPSPAFEGGVEKHRSGSTLSKSQPSGWRAEGLTLIEERVYYTLLNGGCSCFFQSLWWGEDLQEGLSLKMPCVPRDNRTHIAVRLQCPENHSVSKTQSFLDSGKTL
jgi:hypothetical protein